MRDITTRPDSLLAEIRTRTNGNMTLNLWRDKPFWDVPKQLRI